MKAYSAGYSRSKLRSYLGTIKDLEHFRIIEAAIFMNLALK